MMKIDHSSQSKIFFKNCFFSCLKPLFLISKLGILFSTAVRAVVVVKLVILGISHLTSFILGSRKTLVAKLLILGISPLTLFILALRETFYYIT